MILQTIRGKFRIENLAFPRKEEYDVRIKYFVDHDSRS